MRKIYFFALWDDLNSYKKNDNALSARKKPINIKQ